MAEMWTSDASGWITRSARRAQRRLKTRVRQALAVAMVLILGTLGMTMSPRAQAADPPPQYAGTVTKERDPVQSAGYTAPDTFQTGALVRYRLTFACSSNVSSCGVGTFTDVLDPALQYSSIIFPTTAAGGAPAPVFSTPSVSAYSATTGTTVSFTIGTAAKPWPDGNTFEAVLVAKVRSDYAGGTVPNQGSISVTKDGVPGPTNLSQKVNIVVPSPTKSWTMDKTANKTTVAPGEIVTYLITFFVPQPGTGTMAASSVTIVDTFPAGALVVNAAGQTIPDGGLLTEMGGYSAVVNYTAHTVTWTLGPASPTDVNCSGPGPCVSTAYYPTPRLNLRFPADVFTTAGQVLVNSATATFKYVDGTTGTLTDTANVTLQGAKHDLYPDKYFPSGAKAANYVAGEKVSYLVYGTNNGVVGDRHPAHGLDVGEDGRRHGIRLHDDPGHVCCEGGPAQG